MGRLMRTQARVWDTVAWRRLVRLGLAFALLVAALVSVHLYRLSRVVRAESAFVRARVAVVTAPYAGRIASLRVEEGELVSKGQSLAILDTSLLQREVEEAKAKVLEAVQEVASMEASYRQRKERQVAERAKVETDLATAQGELLASQARRHAQLAVAGAGKREAKAHLLSSAAALALAESGARAEELDAARARLRAAGEEVALKRTAAARASTLYAEGAASAAYLDESKTALAVSEARRDEAKAGLAQLEKGSRPEELDARRAEKKAAEARLAETEARERLAAAEGLAVERCALAVTGARALRDRVLADDRELEVLEQQIGQAKSRLGAAQAAETKARCRMETATLTASTSGRVSEISVGEGQWVGAHQEVLRVVETGAYRIEARVREKDVSRIREGMKATVLVDAVRGARAKLGGEVVGMGGISNSRGMASASSRSRQGTVSVWLSCEQTPDLVPGMSVMAVMWPEATR